MPYQDHSYTAPIGAMRRKKGMETILPPKVIEYRIQREMKKTDTHFQTTTKQR
jgi:hypothetical protein